jgi:hypothetical protein
VQTTAIIDGRHRAPAIPPAKSSRRVSSIRGGAAIVVAITIELILVLGFVGAILGLGYEGYARAGADRPPPPSTPAPGQPPTAISVVAGARAS